MRMINVQALPCNILQRHKKRILTSSCIFSNSHDMPRSRILVSRQGGCWGISFRNDERAVSDLETAKCWIHPA